MSIYFPNKSRFEKETIASALKKYFFPLTHYTSNLNQANSLRDAAFAERDRAVGEANADRDAALAERDRAVSEANADRDAALAERDRAVGGLETEND